MKKKQNKSILELYLEYRKEKNKEKDLLKKKFNSLSLPERNAYEEIIKRNSESTLTIEMIILPIRVLIYAALFCLASFYLLNVDIKEPLVLVITTIFKIWLPLIVLGLAFDFWKAYKAIKLEKELLLNKR
jgi:hypothetical protein